VADFRDPWARAPWRDDRPSLAARARVALERRVVSRANAVVFNTDRARQEFTRHYGPALSSRFHVIANGCDVMDTAASPRQPDHAFVLLHAGSLYGQRSPAIVLRALANAIRRGALAADRVKLRLVGLTSPPADLIALAASLNLAAAVEIVPRVPRREALAEMSAASALLLLQQGHALSIPAKAYEYLAAGKPILAIADDGATADLIRDSGAGTVVDGRDVDAVERAMLRLTTGALEASPRVARNVYDGAARAAELAALLATIARPSPASTSIPSSGEARTRRAS
jgi:glycosyltransferase involved in cell wall biosynthesis